MALRDLKLLSLSLFNLLQEGSFANSVALRQDICMGKTSLEKKVLPGVQICNYINREVQLLHIKGWDRLDQIIFMSRILSSKVQGDEKVFHQLSRKAKLHWASLLF